jgi:hypothetical protein
MVNDLFSDGLLYELNSPLSNTLSTISTSNVFPAGSKAMFDVGMNLAGN